MIIVKLKGGLGNQMFQYATGLNISIKNKVPLRIDVSGYINNDSPKTDTPRSFDLKYFSISGKIANKNEVNKIKNPYGIFSKFLRLFSTKILRRYFRDYHPKILEKKKYYLDGYWQSEKNFEQIRNLLLEEFKLKEISKNYKNALSKISDNSLSMHIRRGDYANDNKTNKCHGLLPKKYYIDALKLVREKVTIEQVVIFTDDAEWVKNNFDFIKISTLYSSDLNLSAPEELLLMSKCSHNITANSSFSWWGSWLNENPNKIVIAPKIWFRKGENKHKNIVPKTWIRI